MLSAKYYAQSTVPFEEVALKFVERDERDALRSYLLTKVDKLKKVVSHASSLNCHHDPLIIVIRF
jgi:hypothetical protein